MKKLLVGCLFMLSGCVSTPVINQANLQNVNFADLLNQKTNRACQTTLFGILPAETEASIAKAAWEAGITHVSYVENSSAYLFPLMVQHCVVVYGE